MTSPGTLAVVDLGVGLGAVLAAAHFVDLGVPVHRLDPRGGDPFAEIYPVYRSLRSGELAITDDQLEPALASADVCILGGEDFPGLVRRADAEAIFARHPHLVILELGGGRDAEGREMPAVELLAQARSGLCFDQTADRPFAWPLPVASFAMALHGLIGVWAALIARAGSGQGCIVRTSLQHGAAAVTAPDRMSYERPSDQARTIVPRDVRQLILKCADGRYVQFAKPPGTLAKIYGVFGIPVTGDPATFEARERPTDPRDFFGNYPLFSAKAAAFTSDELLARFWAAAIPADIVLAPGECWDDPQVEANGIIRTRGDGVRTVRFPAVLRQIEGEPGPARASAGIDGVGPLAGVRVIGLGAYIAGPYAARMLADLGAEVIKVDALGGDPSAGTYGHWWVCNSGKRSIRINVKTPEGLELLHRLCASADVVHHNFRPGVPERLGVDPASLRARAPGTVTLQCSAYGTTGPKADYPGFDQIALGLTGNEVRAGGTGNAPIWYRHCIVDYTAGMIGSIATLIGLFERLRGGCAIEAEVNLLDTALYLMSELVKLPDGSFAGAPPNDFERLGTSATQHYYQTNDGWIAVAARGAAMEQRLWAVLGLSTGRTADALAARFGRMSTSGALQVLGDAQVWAARCVNLQEMGMDADPAAAAAGLVRAFADPVMGTVIGTGPLVSLFPGDPRGPLRAPQIGEDASQLALEIGYSEGQVADFLQRSIIA